MKTLIKISGLFLISSILILNVGCSGGASSALPDLTPGSGGILPGTSDGIAAAGFFYVGVDSTVNPIAQVHTQSSFSAECAISPNSTTNEDVSCLVDIPEGEVYNAGVAFKIHAPKDMCRYIRRRTYWYYNQEVGFAPASIVLNATVSGTQTVSFNCSVNGGAADPGCSSQTEFSVNMTNAAAPKFACVYDTSGFTGGANCCIGNRTVTVNITDTSLGGGAVPGTPTLSTWGGSITNCIGGAGKTSWADFTAQGYPTNLVTPAGDGVDIDYKVEAPIKRKLGSTLAVANYHNPTLHTHDGFFLAGIPNTTVKPYYVDPVDDRDGTPIKSGNDTYTVECLDAAYEIKHRIQVYVREWDTYPDYTTFISTAGATTVPDRGLGNPVEPTGCAGIAGNCDDFHDADDFLQLDLSLGAYDTTPGNILNRASYFPYESY